MRAIKFVFVTTLLATTFLLAACNPPGGVGGETYGPGVPEDAIRVTDLHAHPKEYQPLNGQQATVVGYVDFDNILDQRETYYDHEAIGFVSQPGQTGDVVFFADLDTSLDPRPLFDRLYCLRPDYETKGLQIAVTGTLHVSEQLTNFTTGLGYEMDVSSLDDVVILAAGCEMAGSIVPALPNADYPIDVTASGHAQLANGVFEEEAAPGSAARTRVSLGEQITTGDLDGDGVLDAAVTLVADPGGSGTFVYLAAVLNRDGAAEPVASVLLGDRIVVKSLVVEDGEITVAMLTRQEDEPMSAEPTVAVTQVFRLQDGVLSEVQAGD